MATGDIGRPWAFYLGVASVAAAILMLQVILTRIISVTSWYHLAFFVIGIAMFGMTAGAIVVYRPPARFGAYPLRVQLVASSLAFAASTAASIVLLLSFITGAPVSFMSAVIWLQVAAVASAPFFFAGVALTLALTRTSLPIGRVYAADLVGAGIGCLAVLAVLNLTDGPTAVLWTSLLPVGASFLFAGSGPTGDERTGTQLARLRSWQLGTLACLLAACLLNGSVGAVRPVMIKDAVENPADLIFEGWNSFSRITVKRTELSLPPLAGPSPGLVLSPVEQRWMTIDGAAGTGIYRFDGDLAKVAFLKSDVTALAYAIPGLETGAVIGVGGGRDILTALLFGLKTVVGVELNPMFGQLLMRDYADFTALARHPGVTIEIDEARSWFSRTSRSFDVVQMSLIDTWAATGAGAFTLSENGLYTVEAWRMILRRLTAPGVFTVSRWYSAGDFSETGRMISLAMASLLAENAPEPRRHVFVATTGNVATLVLAREPLSSQAVGALETWARDKGFEVLARPGAASPSGLVERILQAETAAELDRIAETTFLDISPPSDSRPFFFNQLKLSSLLDPGLAARAWQPGVFGGNLVATVTLATLVLVSLLLVVAVILLPLRSALLDVDGATVAAGTTYFAAIGAGFMLAEIGLLQRLSIFLGHPVYALSVVLFGLIISAGIGSLVSERYPLVSTRRLVVWAAALAGYLALLPSLGGALFERFEPVDVAWRLLICVVLIAPAGILMGFGFPTGLNLARRANGGLGPWLWGINGAAGVLASGVAVLISIQLGIPTVFYLAAGCYLITAAAGCLLHASLPANPAAVEVGAPVKG